MSQKVMEFKEPDTGKWGVLEEARGGQLRLVLLQHKDGFKTVIDIWEFDADKTAKVLEDVAETHELDVRTEIYVPFEVNLGRATTNEGICKKIQEAVTNRVGQETKAAVG